MLVYKKLRTKHHPAMQADAPRTHPTSRKRLPTTPETHQRSGRQSVECTWSKRPFSRPWHRISTWRSLRSQGQFCRSCWSFRVFSCSLERGPRGPGTKGSMSQVHRQLRSCLSTLVLVAEPKLGPTPVQPDPVRNPPLPTDTLGIYNCAAYFNRTVLHKLHAQVPYLEYMVQACPEASNDVLFRLIPSLKRDGCTLHQCSYSEDPSASCLRFLFQHSFKVWFLQKPHLLGTWTSFLGPLLDTKSMQNSCLGSVGLFSGVQGYFWAPGRHPPTPNAEQNKIPVLAGPPQQGPHERGAWILVEKGFRVEPAFVLQYNGLRRMDLCIYMR